jgi:hypothetical protein
MPLPPLPLLLVVVVVVVVLLLPLVVLPLMLLPLVLLPLVLRCRLPPPLCRCCWCRWGFRREGGGRGGCRA